MKLYRMHRTLFRFHDFFAAQGHYFPFYYRLISLLFLWGGRVSILVAKLAKILMHIDSGGNAGFPDITALAAEKLALVSSS
jgi:hypothetical protein